jgi:hypothetical protein
LAGGLYTRSSKTTLTKTAVGTKSVNARGQRHIVEFEKARTFCGRICAIDSHELQSDLEREPLDRGDARDGQCGSGPPPVSAVICARAPTVCIYAPRAGRNDRRVNGTARRKVQPPGADRSVRIVDGLMERRYIDLECSRRKKISQ